MSAEDRIAVILGRAVMRAEAFQAENERLRALLSEHETDDAPEPEKETTGA